MRDGSRPTFPEYWKREVRMLEVDSSRDSVLIEARNVDVKADMVC